MRGLIQETSQVEQEVEHKLALKLENLTSFTQINHMTYKM